MDVYMACRYAPTSLPLRKLPIASREPNTFLRQSLFWMSQMAFFKSIIASANSYSRKCSLHVVYATVRVLIR